MFYIKPNNTIYIDSNLQIKYDLEFIERYFLSQNNLSKAQSVKIWISFVMNQRELKNKDFIIIQLPTEQINYRKDKTFMKALEEGQVDLEKVNKVFYNEEEKDSLRSLISLVNKYCATQINKDATKEFLLDKGNVEKVNSSLKEYIKESMEWLKK